MSGILEERIGARRALPGGERAVLAVALAAADVGVRMEAVLSERGLTRQRYNVLRMLRGAGASGLSYADVATRLLVRAPDVTRLVDPLVEAGWVRRDRGAADRRVVLHRLTTAGARLLEDVGKPLGSVYGAVARVLGADLPALVALCERLIEAAADGRLDAGAPDARGEAPGVGRGAPSGGRRARESERAS